MPIPFLAKLQIVAAVGIFEHISEDKNFLAADGTAHYMRGGKPGYMPTFKANVHPSPLNLWDPFGFTKYLSPIFSCIFFCAFFAQFLFSNTCVKFSIFSIFLHSIFPYSIVPT